MKKLDLQNFGVQEMNTKEMEEMYGGGIFGAIIGAIVGAVVGLFADSATVNGQPVDGVLAGAISGAILGGTIIPF